MRASCLDPGQESLAFCSGSGIKIGVGEGVPATGDERGKGTPHFSKWLVPL
jgi:hypothetical protein